MMRTPFSSSNIRVTVCREKPVSAATSAAVYAGLCLWRLHWLLVSMAIVVPLFVPVAITVDLLHWAVGLVVQMSK
jgi:anti-sigma-K factor RskA